jgi:hypothetical protein
VFWYKNCFTFSTPRTSPKNSEFPQLKKKETFDGNSQEEVAENKSCNKSPCFPLKNSFVFIELSGDGYPYQHNFPPNRIQEKIKIKTVFRIFILFYFIFAKKKKLYIFIFFMFLVSLVELSELILVKLSMRFGLELV